jgi:hypothetical protein
MSDLPTHSRSLLQRGLISYWIISVDLRFANLAVENAELTELIKELWGCNGKFPRIKLFFQLTKEHLKGGRKKIFFLAFSLSIARWPESHCFNVLMIVTGSKLFICNEICYLESNYAKYVLGRVVGRIKIQERKKISWIFSCVDRNSIKKSGRHSSTTKVLGFWLSL